MKEKDEIKEFVDMLDDSRYDSPFHRFYANLDPRIVEMLKMEMKMCSTIPRVKNTGDKK